ncbi:hypothetical protein QBC44DRAFT_232339 [Cladorrhinum sp. PSN332]|nr:hypothetical protein QBC44DRAFT_232339 [Cladorrhinum sp. PSN332]
MENRLSFNAAPLITPTSTSPHILVVGGGVTGLITTWVLLDAGYKVTVMSKEWASYAKGQRLTSQIAGALWEFPPAVCGQHTDPISLHNSKKWCMVAYRVWDHIAADAKLSLASGVRMKKSAFFFPYPVTDNQEQLDKMREIEASGVREFIHSGTLVQHYGISQEYNCVDAYELLAPIIDTDRAMSWLMRFVAAKGATLVPEAVCGDLLDCEDELRIRFGADVIVNTTGLAGQEIAADPSCYPIRGGLLRVINDGTKFPKVDAALSVSADTGHSAHTANEIIFIVPRSDRILLLGGISEPHEWKLDYTLDSPMIKRLKSRCEAFLPGLENAQLDEEYPLAQGLRPFRKNNVRVERELRPRRSLSDTSYGSDISRIVHSYGHGGAGWSLSFGCAEDVLNLVEETLAGLPPKPMALE